MASSIPQDGRPHGMLDLIELTEQLCLQSTPTSYLDAPSFHLVVAPEGEDRYLHRELVDVLHANARETGVRYFLLKQLDDDETQHLVRSMDSLSRMIVWLGPSQEDSNTAMRCISRLPHASTSRNPRKLWSRREGQALLNLSERAVWRHLPPHLLASLSETWLYCGTFGVSWQALLNFRQLLLDLAATGRMAHHQFAHALLGSQASRVIEAAVEEREHSLSLSSLEFPPPTDHIEPLPGLVHGMNELSAQLDTSIHTVETRWSMLEQSVLPLAGTEALSEADLDAEIARYTQLLQQMDVLEADLEHLDSLTTHVRCSQYEARTPRGSPEISP